MAGLPRAGSTMLSSILNQNPRFYSGPSSPVVPTMLALEQSLSQDELFLAYPKVDFGKNLIASVLPQYYSDTDKHVIFEKNRSWVNRMEYLSVRFSGFDAINGYFIASNGVGVIFRLALRDLFHG